MYPTDRFLYWATKKLDAKVSPKTIEEIKQTNPEVKRETRTYFPNFVSSAGYAGFPTTLASSIGYAGFPTTFAPSLGYAEFPTTFSLYPPGLVATSTRSLIREKDWGDFIRTMSPFEREYLVKILDEVMINPPLLISTSLDPIGFSVSES